MTHDEAAKSFINKLRHITRRKRLTDYDTPTNVRELQMIWRARWGDGVSLGQVRTSLSIIGARAKMTGDPYRRWG